LQRHFPAETVKIETCDDGIFLKTITLFFHDRGEGCYLEGCEPERVGGGTSVGVPERFVFVLHTDKESFGGDIPEYLVSVGNKESLDGFRSEAEGTAVCRIGKEYLETVSLKH
jgi:hypothetical protein